MINKRNDWLSGKFIVCILFFSSLLLAKPVKDTKALRYAENWLKQQSAHGKYIKKASSKSVKSINTYSDDNSEPIYYVLSLEPSGFIICSSDDAVEPIICFSQSGRYNPVPKNPLFALVEQDLRGRLDNLKKTHKKNSAYLEKQKKASRKWDIFETDSDTQVYAEMSLSGLDDVRVSPFLETTWSQSTVCSEDCYNYYTPENYVCGCVATAMAQLMRYHQFPSEGIGQNQFDIEVDDVSQSAYTIGGDGVGGPYLWSLMEATPNCSITESQRQAIGALCYDAGLSVGMSYASDGSSSDTLQASNAFVNTFGFSNSVAGKNGGNNIGQALNGMANPNLDAGLPVILGITDGTYGHAIITDGYGHNLGTLYHHLNMGWSGTDNAWYNLPDIDTSNRTYTSVYKCVYNIFISVTGEIISGRVSDIDGEPVSNANVTAVSSSKTHHAVTDSNGIYAFVGLYSNTEYTITVDMPGLSFAEEIRTTSTSNDYQNTSGNIWGVDFQALPASPPSAYDSNEVVKPGLTAVITLNGNDEGMPNPPGLLEYIIVSLPKYGVLKEASSGNVITSQNIPYTLVSNSNDLEYISPLCFSRPVSFQFKVNDGGDFPDGGDSNIATFTIWPDLNDVELIYSCDFEDSSGWTIVDGYSDGFSWVDNNPENRSDTHDVWDGKFMIIDSDWAGYNVDMDEMLISPMFDFSDYSEVSLQFNHYFKQYSNEICGVYVRIDGGEWFDLAQWGGGDEYGLVNLDASYYADGQSNIQFGWRYYDASFDWFWGIDNVEVYGVAVIGITVGDINMDCFVNTLDFSKLANGWLSTSTDSDWDENLDISDPNDGIVSLPDLYQLCQNWLKD